MRRARVGMAALLGAFGCALQVASNLIVVMAYDEGGSRGVLKAGLRVDAVGWGFLAAAFVLLAHEIFTRGPAE